MGQRGPCGWGCPQPAPAASPCPRATRAGDSSGDGDPGGSPARQHARPQLAASKLIFAREGPCCHQQFMRLLRCDYPSKTALPGNSASCALGKRLGRRSRFRSLFEVTQCPLLFSSPFPFAFLTLPWPEGWATGTGMLMGTQCQEAGIRSEDAGVPIPMPTAPFGATAPICVPRSFISPKLNPIQSASHPSDNISCL